MLYDISLKISYTYGAPSEHSRAVVRLLPSDVSAQQAIKSRLLTIDPMPDERREVLDFFGNAMTILAFHEPLTSITFTLNARAERFAPADSLDLSPSLANLAAELQSSRDLGDKGPHHFLGESERIPFDPEIARFAAAFSRPDQTVRETVRAMTMAIHDEMRFDTVATHVDTPPSEAFVNRHGVCQDFSHVLISSLRSLGIPAGYVSGFLRTFPPEGQPRLEGADAMHAWVSAWCGSEMGWVEVDPTNACIVGLDHIAVAYGRDYADVAPIKGSMRTSGEQSSRHSVDVMPI